ncbi:MAG: phycobilisome protein [Cyanobacteria bacterium J06632_22]
MSTSLTPQVKALIEKAQIVSFASWCDRYSADLIDRLQQANTDRRYLYDDDLAALQQSGAPAANIAAAQQLRDHASQLVDQARAQVLEAFPGITAPAGRLFPEMRAEACWRDFWQFLRCVSYGVAAGQTDYTDTTGLHYMEQLYQALQVPLDAMVHGLTALAGASSRQTNMALAPYFDSLIEALSQFQPADLPLPPSRSTPDQTGSAQESLQS